MEMFVRNATASACAAAMLALAAGSAVAAEALTPEQEKFHSIYKELVEINTTHSSGDNTQAARAMEKRLVDAGFAPGDIEIFEPFPKKGNMVLRFKGDGSKKPMLLLAHIDVVEAKREDWKTDPFKLQETGGYFTARGATDDKAMASAFVSVLGQLKAEGFKPKRDIILALTADEERGDVPSNGAFWLVNNKRDFLNAEFGVNEGASGELRNGKPSLQRVQVAEKMYATYNLEVRDVGGHSSVPTANNPVYALSEGLARLGAYQFPVNLADVTKAYFGQSAQLNSGQVAEDMKAVSEGKPDAAALARLSANPLYNAQLRTTCVATMVNAGHAENALPQSAKSVVNCRILPHDDPEAIDKQLKDVLGSKIAVKVGNTPLKSPASPVSGEVIAAVQSITKEMWPGVPLVPIMSTGASDSRFMRNAGIPMYGISGIFADPADARAHGLDERVEIQRLYDAREFMYKLVKQLAS